LARQIGAAADLAMTRTATSDGGIAPTCGMAREIGLANALHSSRAGEDAMGLTALYLVVVGLTGTMIPTTATAASAKDSGAAPAAASKMRVGITLVPTPFGVLHSASTESESSVGSVFAFAVMPTFDFVLHPNTFIGLAPSYTFHIKARGADVDPSRQLDLLLRLGGTAPVGLRFHPYGYLALGYSFISDLPGGAGAQGLVIGLHGGSQIDLTPTLFLAAELGYQAGFQRDLHSLTQSEARTSFVQIGAGIGVRI
jgi:hypothetical protein